MSVIDTAMKGFRKVFGSRNDRMVKMYRRLAERVHVHSDRMMDMTDTELRQHAQTLRAAITSGQQRIEEVRDEALAIMRESLDRQVGIRNILNPDHAGAFDPSRLPDAARQLYEQTQALAEATAAERVPGAAEPVPGWMLVEIPVALYKAVRDLYPISRPPFRTRPFEVQLIGGMVLHGGKIAEMKTGEGKTIVAPLACFLAAMEGLRCHVVTVNDYLVQRDRDWVFPAFHHLGMTVGAIHPFHMQPEELKREAYNCDVTYGTNSEFGFDYLRDNMKLGLEDQVQKRREFCIVDEIDSILIDEARTPLIISGPAHDDAPQYHKANQVAERLKQMQEAANRDTAQRLRQEGFAAECARTFKVPESQVAKTISKFTDLGADFLDEKEADLLGHVQYYVVKKEQKQAAMTHLGVEEAQNIVGTRFYVVGNDMAWDHLINNALRAHAVYENDREYVVQNGEVVIVDEFTGRLMIGRQWSDGLHQAIEAKEARHGVKIKQETQTLATVTIQNFFKLYKRLAGMTGTAITEATEFHEIYGLDVVMIPTNRPVIRADMDDLIFLTQRAKWDAIIEDIVEKARAGRPVLVGTTSVEKSEFLSQHLAKKHHLDHEVLNAKQHEREAMIVSKAGQTTDDGKGHNVGNITIATNMAGRGTDIKLSADVLNAGGLHIIGTERHEARRIDNQLRGRAGRQGDAGSSRFFISMEDDLMKMFAGKSTMKALNMLGMKEDDAIEHKWITRSVERAQTKVEQRSYQIRKNLLEYDEVMEYQRNAFYATRQQVLEGKGIDTLIFEHIAEAIEDATARFLGTDYVQSQVAEGVRAILHVSIDPVRLRGDTLKDVEPHIRSDAKADAGQEIEVTVGEYMSDDIDSSHWDLKGLSQWAMTRFSADMKMSRLREMSPDEVIRTLTETAHGLIDRKPLDGLSRFYEPRFAEGELAAWARAKFGLELTPEELSPRDGERRADAQQRVADLIFGRAREAYERRTIEYPVSFVMEMTDAAILSGDPNAARWAIEQLSAWVKQRFDMDWTPEGQIDADLLFRQFLEASEQWNGPKLDDWVTQSLADKPDAATLRERFKSRWRVELTEDEVPAATMPDAPRRQALRLAAKRILRSELTQLEQYVLLQILDQTWKDHLYAMDQLKDSVGLQGYAEKDPKIVYKTEGSHMFRDMLRSVRDKVTDMIFKARLTPNVERQSVYQNMHAEHEVIEDTSVAASLTAGGPLGTDEQRADLESARHAGRGEETVVQTIVNDAPRVGRNDPCPCGSGKKYKKCCGTNS